jgi:hypothetical protein
MCIFVYCLSAIEDLVFRIYKRMGASEKLQSIPLSRNLSEAEIAAFAFPRVFATECYSLFITNHF